MELHVFREFGHLNWDRDEQERRDADWCIKAYVYELKRTQLTQAITKLSDSLERGYGTCFLVSFTRSIYIPLCMTFY